MRKITKSTRSKYTVHHQKLRYVNNHKAKSFGKKLVTLFDNVKSATKVFSTIVINIVKFVIFAGLAFIVW
jgi:hypothetical protein